MLWRIGRENPAALYHAVSLAALYLHFGRFAEFVAEHTRGVLAEEGSLSLPRAGGELSAVAAPGAVVTPGG